MFSEIRRRELILVALGSPLLLGFSGPPSRSVRAFDLVEPSGLRRFGYPIHAIVPDAAEGRNFRLLRNGRALPAQFRVEELAHGRREVHLDFNASPGPNESQRYEVLFGPDVEPGPELNSGLKVEGIDERFRVEPSSGLRFDFSKRPQGFLEAVGGPRLEYLREGSGGLSIVEDARPAPSQPPKLDYRSQVTREGPMAVGIRSEWTTDSGLASTLDLTLPQSKSWVQAVWSVDDTDGRVSNLSIDLNLKLEGASTLVDFGAGSTVYGQIQGHQRMVMEAGRKLEGPEGWMVRQGEGEEPAILASSTASSPRVAEGWAHVMDARRCTALAIADFGKTPGAIDRISVEADGHLRFTRVYQGPVADRPSVQKRLAFWLHFVPMPVQIGAVTSPQSMLASPRVEWDR